MEGFFRFLGLAAGGAVLGMTVRSAHKEMGAVVSLACGAMLFLLLGDKMREAVGAFRDMAELAAIDNGKTALILRVLGISLLSEFAAQACRDAGENGIALRVELGGKVMLLTLSLPLLREITQLILEMTK